MHVIENIKMTRCFRYSSRVFALMMKTAEERNSATTHEAPVCPAERAGSVALGTPCVAQETAAAMVRRGVPSEMNTHMLL